MARVLLVDDAPTVLLYYQKVLSRAGFEVDAFDTASAAITAFEEHRHDVVVTDLCMPEMDGLDLMRALRRVDADVPVVIVTAAPTLETAVRAVEYGALQYLIKPVSPTELSTVARKAWYLGRIARMKREALALMEGPARAVGDRAGLEVAFETALERLYTVYQPLVDWSERRVVGYEALVRSQDTALPGATQLLEAAERLGRVEDLGRVSRAHACSHFKDGTDSSSRLFINVHPSELHAESLYSRTSPWAQLANRVVLEITERASIETIGDVPSRMERLRDLGFRIAIDDLGAGYSGLTAFSLLQPDICKLDMSLIRGVEASVTKQKLIRTMVELCGELEIELIAEGVETPNERDQLTDLGCRMFQGYLFARPNTGKPEVVW